MVKRGNRTRAKSRTSRPRAARDSSATRLGNIGKASAQIVKDAAALLDEEIAAGIIAAKRMQERFQKERRIDAADFQDALQRLQSDAHGIVNLFNDQIAELRTDESAAIMTKLVNNTHGLLDLAVGLVTTGAEIANQLIQAKRPKQKARARAKRRG